MPRLETPGAAASTFRSELVTPCGGRGALVCWCTRRFVSGPVDPAERAPTRALIRRRPLSSAELVASWRQARNILLGRGGQRCYRGCMTVFRYDYDLLTGMPASTVALSCADTISGIATVWTMPERRSSRQPRCFRLFSQPSAPAVGVCPGRKQGPEEKSHKNLSFAVLPAWNVA
jgi:hypothetical protein